ncbi:biotin--[acetyl-CoA-carboxylase] ligase [Candidatus Blochmannia ocreatus (nom. nud.)]|uniref:biotin--[biotin carboxyl-carrier protein] ligase n=1 Tax=Candidatus Blochmannia ocreatus (nom. nud.) TaxID=251538 RepID=A0ABY4SZJ7_9ENTR|nr:biotin--[acetyl-CoA-carboxylase] ligase [Candidatus Blochmannia ocreatus]URJ25264.1 biotin--[acetyl-CoA-carboxylase] ligase [Candidatus Blochmannia ocreatus]
MFHHDFFLPKQNNLSQLLLKNRIIVLKKINSTNQYIIDNIPRLKIGDACVTDHQTQGRGRTGKIWIAPIGQSICLSMYWKLNKTLPTIIKLSIMISIVVARILKKLGVSHIKIKWPNDLYVNERKLAGILIETITKAHCTTHLIIGIGLNISIQTPTQLNSQIGKNWIDLKSIGIIINRNFLTKILVNTLRKKLKDFTLFDLEPFMTHWKYFDYLYNKSILLSINNCKIIYGIALGINSHGALILKKSEKIYYFSGGNISIQII